MFVSKYNSILSFVLLTFLLISCQVQKFNKIKNTYDIEIQHTFGDQPLILNQKYVTISQDTVVFTKFQYYLSNISIKSSEGVLWEEENSYRLFRLSSDHHIWQIPIILPFDDFDNISFAIGIDSLQNSQGQQNGDLDPLNGMFWTWKTGYIFFKVEGYTWNNKGERFPLIIHIGSNNCYREIFWKVENPITLKIKLDLQKIFGIEKQLKLGNKIQIMGEAKSIRIADSFVKTLRQIK